MPSPEKKESDAAKESGRLEQLIGHVKQNFDRFLSLSDEPGEFISGDEKIELIDKMAAGKRPDADEKIKKEAEEARERFERNKNSKYRSNSLSIPLAYASLLLDKKDFRIDDKKRAEFLEMIDKAKKDILDVTLHLITSKDGEDMHEIIKGVIEAPLIEIIKNKIDNSELTDGELELIIFKSKKSPFNLKEDLMEKIHAVLNKNRENKKGLLTDNEVNQVVNLVKELKKYL